LLARSRLNVLRSSTSVPISDVCGGTRAECTSGPFAKGLCCGVVTVYENQ
jgi:hypothetical protein